MEYASSGAATSAGWSNSGSPTWAYATSPAPLIGSYSLKYDNSNYTTKDFSAQSDCWVFFAFNLDSLAAQRNFFRLWSSAPATIVEVFVKTTGKMAIGHGGVYSADGSFTVSINTTYYVWIHYTKGTGSNGVAELYVSSSATKPGSADCSLSNGAGNVDVAKVACYVGSAANVTIDYLRVSSATIGSNP